MNLLEYCPPLDSTRNGKMCAVWRGPPIWDLTHHFTDLAAVWSLTFFRRCLHIHLWIRKCSGRVWSLQILRQSWPSRAEFQPIQSWQGARLSWWWWQRRSKNLDCIGQKIKMLRFCLKDTEDAGGGAVVGDACDMLWLFWLSWFYLFLWVIFSVIARQDDSDCKVWLICHRVAHMLHS